MHPIRLIGLAGVALSVVVIAPQGRINYRDETFELRGFAKFSAELVEGGIAFQGQGSPAEAEAKTAGMTLRGQNLMGEAKRGPSGAYHLTSFEAQGDASLFLAAVVPQTGGTTMRADPIRYRGTPTEGTLEMPSAFRMESKTSGPLAVTPGAPASKFEQTMTFTGAYATVDLVLGAAGTQLRKGNATGPVTLTMVRIEGEGAAAVRSTLDGKADSMTFDLAPEGRFVVLKGNVTVDGKGPVIAGTFLADTMRFTLDERFNVLKVEIEGAPATTRIRDARPTGARN